MSKTSKKPVAGNKTVVVAIGASAGGLKAFEQFFKAAPASPGVAFVLIPHLDPRRHSMMADLVGKYTKMPVEQVDDGVVVKPNHVYIIPPNTYLSIKNGRLKLEAPIELRGVRMAIDFFFRSLAESERERAIGIVFSGTATDGTQGLKSIKENGGMAMVQDPLTAQHDGMPRSAINTGMVDFILPPDKMPETLLNYVQHHYVRAAAEPAEKAEPQPDQEDELEKALSVIHARTGHDFRVYKRGTINRRVQRRMGLHQIQKLKDYISLLRKDESEVRLLFDDLLIGVTQFYRDPESFSILESEAIDDLVARDDKDPLRVWVPGCSTGEEAYSIAISCLDAAANAGRHITLQVFATDIDERALSFGRNAIYPESIVGDLSADRLNRYFTKEDHSYRVNKHVREAVVFASQDLIHDPPFSKLDLISCRNLLIYLEPEIQQKILSLFSFALNEDGYLFLGGSETLSRTEGAFTIVHKKTRLFKKSRGAGAVERPPFPIVPTKGATQLVRSPDPVTPNARGRLADLIRGELLEGFAPASVVINEKCEVLFNWGSTSKFLAMPNGEPTNDLLALARRGLRIKLRQLIREVFSNGNTHHVDAQVTGGENVRITGRLIHNPRLDAPLCMVSFLSEDQIREEAPQEDTETAEIQTGTDADDALVSQLEVELRSTREELQGTIEELESSNEELKTANEEAMSMNEELQSANEELETSKEELQSLNEELSTVNSELQEKLELLEKANNDLNNLLASTDIATVFLDHEGIIRRFTPTARTLFNLIVSDVGRPINDIAHNIVGEFNLVEDAKQVIKDLKPIEDEIQDSDGNWYIRRLAPYRTADNRIEGAVVTFTDVSTVKAAEESMRSSEARYRALYENSPAMCFTLDENLVIQSVNALGADQLRIKRKDLIHKNFLDIHADHKTVESAMEGVLRDRGEIKQWEARMLCQNGDALWTRGLARYAEQGDKGVIFIAAYDISLEKKLSDQVYYHATHDYLTGLLNRREFDVILKRVFDTAKAARSVNALIYIDLSRFKLVNDSAGHTAGDNVLLQVGNLLRNSSRARQRDVIARLGGDEFGVILEHCPIDEAHRIAQSFVESLRNAEITSEGKHFSLDCYIGIVPIDNSSPSTEEVLRHADAACYEAKQLGPGNIHVFDPDSDSEAQKQSEISWAKLIRGAIDDKRLTLACEPIVYGTRGTVAGFEFLLRVSDEHGPLDTTGLISAAERYGLVTELDRRVVRLALSSLSEHIRQLSDYEFFSINLSGQSISNADFVREIEELITNGKVPSKKICFEITETAAVKNIEAAQAFITRLRAIGCRVALDDFGSGLSSFHYLKNLPCDLIKIDGGFVRDILVDESDRSLVAAIHNIAQLLGLETVAEYVENDRIDECVRQIGIDYRQGYCFGEAKPLAEALKSTY